MYIDFHKECLIRVISLRIIRKVHFHSFLVKKNSINFKILSGWVYTRPKLLIQIYLHLWQINVEAARRRYIRGLSLLYTSFRYRHNI